MFRFGSMILGVLLIVGGVYLRWFEEPMSAAPAATTLEDASRLAGSGSDAPRFVDFTGSLDRSGKLYRTGIESPAYARCDPRETHALDGDWTALIGCTVAPVVRPHDVVATVISSRTDAELAPAGALRSRILLAPLDPESTLAWALSPKFLHNAQSEDPARAKYRLDFGRGPLFRMPGVTAEETAWIRSDDLSGPLTRFDELPRNRKDIEADAFLEGLRLAMGANVDSSATYVVLADGRDPILRPVDPSLPRALMPVAGSENLFVALGWDAEPPADGRIAGVLEPLASDAGASVLRITTPDDVNRERVSDANFAMGLGVAFFAFGLVLVALTKALDATGRELRRARR